MSMYSNRLQPTLQTYYNLLFGSSTEIAMHHAYIGGRFRRTKITCKANDMAENLQLYQVVRFFHPRSSCTTHISVDVQRITLNASSCITILDGRTEQLDIIAGFLRFHWLYEWFSQFHSCGIEPFNFCKKFKFFPTPHLPWCLRWWLSHSALWTGMVYRRSQVQFPSRLVDFVFKFQGCMFSD